MTEKKSKDLIIEEEIVDEKRLLKEAEEREKERKAAEEAEREEAKKELKELVQQEHKEKEAKQAQVRRKPVHGKNYRELAKLIEKDKEYSLAEAIDLALKTSPAKFDATVEAHLKINEKEKNIRGTVVLPGGVAKERRVFGITEKNIEDLIVKVKSGRFDFDILVADFKVMPKLAVLAKTLGPKGLMPSPKTGTVVEDVDKALEELKGGKVEYRADKFNIVHLPIGKISFGADKIRQNYEALLSHLPKRLDSIYLTTTMGPSIKVFKSSK